MESVRSILTDTIDNLEKLVEELERVIENGAHKSVEDGTGLQENCENSIGEVETNDVVVVENDAAMETTTV